jgi:hypothetical protein
MLAPWVLATVPFHGPDESAHYIRAVGIASGQLLGPRPGPADMDIPGAQPAQLAWGRHDLRVVFVPGALEPPGTACISGEGRVAAGCHETTWTGDYFPLPYALPAAAIKVAGTDSVNNSLWLARAAGALVCLVFVLIAAALAEGGGPWSLQGLLLALTPATLAIAAVLNPSGLVIAASLAVTVGLLRASRDALAMPTWGWVAVGVSAVVMVLSWQEGPVFLALELVVAGLLAGRQELRTLWRARPNVVRNLGLAVVAALILFVVWSRVSGVVHSTIDFRPVWPAIHLGLLQLGPTLRAAVAAFEGGGVLPPRWLPAAWALLTLAMCVGAFLRTGGRRRIVLVGTTLAALAYPVLFYAWLYRDSGFGLQGRYVLPVLVLVPMLAGALLDQSASARFHIVRNWTVALGISAVAVLQFVAWCLCASNSAGTGWSLSFLSHPLWAPPAGWKVWAAIAALGAVALIAYGATYLALDAPLLARLEPADEDLHTPPVLARRR